MVTSALPRLLRSIAVAPVWSGGAARSVPGTKPERTHVHVLPPPPHEFPGCVGRRLAAAIFLFLAVLWQTPAGALTLGSGADDTVTVPTFTDVNAYNTNDGKDAGTWVRIGTRTLPNWMISRFFGENAVTSDKLIKTYANAAAYLADTTRATRLFAVIGSNIYSVVALESLNNNAALTDSNLPDTIGTPVAGTALGDNADAVQAATAVGWGSEAEKEGATALGSGARAGGMKSVAVGESSVVFDGRSIAVGHFAVTSGAASTVVGTNANGFGADAAVLGDHASVIGDGNTALGRHASAADWGAGNSEWDAVPEGLGDLIRCATEPGYITDGQWFSDECSALLTATEKAHANLFPDTSAGRTYRGTIQTRLRARLNSYAVNRATAVGSFAYARATAATALGANAVASGDASVAVGSGSRVYDGHSVAVGDRALTTGGTSTIVGAYTGGFGKDAAVLGNHASAIGEGNTALGRGATAADWGPGNAHQWDAISAIGLTELIECAMEPGYIAGGQGFSESCSNVLTSAEKAHANLVADTAAGRTYRGTVQTRLRARLDSYAVDWATAVGSRSYARGTGATAMGANAVATDLGATTLGFVARADGRGATALGYLARADGRGATAVGVEAQASGTDAIALGRAAAATGRNAIAVGAGASAGADQVVIGRDGHSYRLPGLAPDGGVARLLAVDTRGQLVAGAVQAGTGAPDFGVRLAALEAEAVSSGERVTTLESGFSAVDDRLGDADDGADRGGNAYQRITALDNDLGAATQPAHSDGSAYQRIASVREIVETATSEDPAAIVAARAERTVEESTRALTAEDAVLRRAIENADSADRVEKVRIRTGTGEERTVVTLRGATNEQIMTLVALLTDRRLSTTVAAGADGEPVGTTMNEFLELDELHGHNVVSTKERLAYLFQALYGPDYAGRADGSTDSDAPHRQSIEGRVRIIELDDEGKKLREADDSLGDGAHRVVVQETSPQDGRGRLRTMPFDNFDGAAALRKVDALTGRVDNLRRDLDELDTHVDRVAAMTSALTALPNAVAGGDRYSLGMGVGHHRGEQALALGMSVRLVGERNVFANAGVALGEGSTVTARAGVSVSW